jgi:hypothetical protein
MIDALPVSTERLEAAGVSGKRWRAGAATVWLQGRLEHTFVDVGLLFLH